MFGNQCGAQAAVAPVGMHKSVINVDHKGHCQRRFFLWIIHTFLIQSINERHVFGHVLTNLVDWLS